MKKQSLFCQIAALIVGLVALGAPNFLSNVQDETIVRADSLNYAKETFQCNNVRYDSGWDHGITVYYEGESFPANIEDMSYGRVILQADATDTYTLGIEYGAGSVYPVKAFVNGVESNYSFPSNGWSASTYNMSVDLALGENVLIISMLKWGVINALALPSGVTLVDSTVTNQTYDALGAESQATKLHVVSGSIHSPDAVVYTKPIQYNSNSSYASKVKFTMDTDLSTDSLDLAYYCATNTDGLSTLQLSINGGSGFDIDLYETANNVVGHKIITSDLLADHGFIAGSVNTVSIIKPYDNSESIGLVSLALSNDTTTSSTVTRNEAESATHNGGSVQSGDASKFSSAGYLGDMGTKTTLTGSNQISSDLSNVNSLSFSYVAGSEGQYSFYIRYATGLTSQAYIRSDVGPWASVNLVSTTWWDTCRVAVVELFLNAGTRTITLTGTTNEGGWVNYDFVDIAKASTLTPSEIALNYAIFFRDQTSSGCSAQNVALIPWSQLKSEYASLSDSVKDEFVASSNTTIADARARYSVLIHTYSSLASDNWLVDGSDVLVFSLSLQSQSNVANNNSFIILILLPLATFVLAFLFFKKTKSEEK